MKNWFHCFIALSFCCLSAENITVIGIGRTGLCLALCLERAGFDVIGVDLSPAYVEQINQKTFRSSEPLVNQLLESSSHFRATTSLEEGLNKSNLCFIVIPTNPSFTTGNYDCRLLDDLLAELGTRKIENKHVVIVSTVPPGYLRDVAIPALDHCPGTVVSYNPIFVAQGDIIKGMQYPEFVLIGSQKAREDLEKIHKKLCLNEPYIAKMSIESAEITKLSLNCYITLKIAFANLVGDIADATPGAEKNDILHALGKDSRIGSKGLNAGYGFGGPCFPRDNRAMADYAGRLNIQPHIFRATDLANQHHADLMAKQLLKLGHDKYLFEDVCYKPKCPVPIIEESQKLVVAEKIAKSGKVVIIKDRAEVITMVQDAYRDLFQYIIERSQP